MLRFIRKHLSAVSSVSVSAFVLAAVPVAIAQELAQSYSIPAQPLAAALETFGQKSHRSVMFDRATIAGVRSNAVTGRMSAEDALERMLRGTGFVMRAVNTHTFVIEPAPADKPDVSTQGTSGKDIEFSQKATNLPEILVVGERSWTLNTDIRRTRDDAQPYIVFDEAQIRRSGATNLEDFFRDYLNASANPGLNAANEANNQVGMINLRGLGSGETLVLVDGRRIAPINSGNAWGRIEQPVLNGIPLSSIERIEVLASSASGIYGGSATGGVVNIILKRDYRGLELEATFGGTVDGGATTRRVNLSSGLTPWEGGNLSATASWQKDDPIEYGQRDFLIDYGNRRMALAPTSNEVPLGATPNYRSANGTPLTFDACSATNPTPYCGTALGASFGSIPVGYRGIGLDGAAGLLANAGAYNMDLASTTQKPSGGPWGSRAQVLNGTESMGGTLSIRQQLTSRIRGFGEIAGNRSKGERASPMFPASTIQLAADAPNNPFQQAIMVSLLETEEPRFSRYQTDTLRATAGVIADLPRDWHASADLAWNHTDNQYGSPTHLSAAFRNALPTTANLLRDQLADPWQVEYLPIPATASDREAVSTTASLRLAGPLPFRLPGGAPTVSMHVQRAETKLEGAVNYAPNELMSQINYSVPRDIRNDAFYFEGRFPLVSPDKGIPLVHALELSLAGRHERYRVDGADPLISCLLVSRPLEDADLATPCPPDGALIERAVVSDSSFNPTFSIKWQPTADVTLRGSYATGYRPQEAFQLVSRVSVSPVYLTDSMRGNEFMGNGFLRTINLISGGNTTLDPEHSDSYTAGVIYAPVRIPHLRLSADWTRIEKRDNYYDPGLLLLGVLGGPDLQTIFEDFIAANPDRVTRNPDPASFGNYGVGPVTDLDLSLVNISGSKIEALDLAADYSMDFAGGSLDFSLAATWAYAFKMQISENSSERNYAGTSSLAALDPASSAGGPEWRGNGTVRYSNENWGLGMRTRMTSGYDLSVQRVLIPAQGAVGVPSQVYFDLFGHYRLGESTEIAMGARNIFNRAPPYDSGTVLRISPYGDANGASYYLTITQRF
ncbi:TonB-dependent receptor domain-containing protein [Luteimonas sp. RIT-PG2_3]